MASTHRLNLLKQAAWRVARGKQRCRLCGGATLRDCVYCLRHFRFLRGHALVSDAAAKRNLDECDALILAKQHGLSLTYRTDRTIVLGTWVYAQALSRGWSLRYLHGDGSWHEEARYETLRALAEAVIDRRYQLSAHNKRATKALIS